MRCILRFLLALTLVFPLFARETRYGPTLTIQPITWNVLGLDHNNVSTGPDIFLVGVRVRNTGDAAATNLQANFVWDSANSYLNLSGPTGLTLDSLPAGASQDFYFNVVVTRNAAAFFTARRYHITASATGASAVSTPTPRELYVEKIVSQNRNSIVSIAGPTTVTVGQTYTYVLNCKTATGGYPQLVHFLNFPNAIFQVLTSSSTYTAPSGGTNDKIYADAGGWDNDPNSPTYREVIGPANYTGGKAGGTIQTTFTVRIVGTGSATLTALIYDYSGSSYHYNSDFGATVLAVTASKPTVTVTASTPDASEAGPMSGVFTVSRVGDTTAALQVDFAMSGTATSGADYADVGTSVTIPAGSSSTTLTLTPSNDALSEGNETAVLTLLSSNNYAVGSPSSATVTIEDDERVVEWTAATQTVGEGTISATVTVTLSVVHTLDVTVPFTLSGTAAPNADYTASPSSPLTISAGTTTASLTLTLVNDAAAESSETVVVTMGTPTNADPGTTTVHTVTITDDDNTPPIAGADSVTVSEDSASNVISVLSNDSDPEGGALTVISVTSPSHGTTNLVGNTIEYTPNADFSGSDSFSYTVSDPLGGTAMATVSVTVTAVNDPPVASADSATVEKNSGPSFVSVLANDTDIDGDPLVIASVGPASHGIVVIVGGGSGLTYQPASGYTGADSFTYTASDGKGGTASATVSVTVQQIPEVVIEIGGGPAGIHGADPLTTLPGGTAGVLYVALPFVAGGKGPFAWSVTPISGNFPFNFDTSTGAVTGAPPAGAYSFVVSVSDSQTPADNDVREFSVTITPANNNNPEINSPTPPDGMLGIAYSQYATATGGTGPYTWSVAAGSLPTGLVLNPYTGQIAGTPVVGGVFTADLQVTDANGRLDLTASGPYPTGQEWTITVNANPVNIDTPYLAGGSVGSAYDQPVESTGGLGPTFAWSVSSGTLPPGLLLSGTGPTATLSGTATTAGVFSFVISIADDGQSGVTDLQPFTVVIAPASSTSVSIATTSMSTGTAGSPYSMRLTAVGGSGSYTWTLTGGSLPAGLSLDPSTGMITGVPVEGGTFSLSFQVTDALGGMDSRLFVLTIAAPPSVATPSPLAAGVIGAGYFKVVLGIGGVAPYGWAIVVPPGPGETGLPTGLAVHALSGALSGIPTSAAGPYVFTVRLTDRNGSVATRQYTLELMSTPTAAAPVVLTKHLSSAQVGVPYSTTVLAAGGDPPYTWSLILGILPAWASFDAASGTIFGTPDLPGTVDLQFMVTDQQPVSAASLVMKLVVTDVVAILTTGLPEGRKGETYSKNLEAAGGIGPYLWEILQGSLPSGLLLNASSGIIQGRPTTTGTYDFLVRVTDAEGRTSAKTIVLTVVESSSEGGDGKDLAGYCLVTPLRFPAAPLGALLGFVLVLLISRVRGKGVRG